VTGGRQQPREVLERPPHVLQLTPVYKPGLGEHNLGDDDLHPLIGGVAQEMLEGSGAAIAGLYDHARIEQHSGDWIAHWKTILAHPTR